MSIRIGSPLSRDVAYAYGVCFKSSENIFGVSPHARAASLIVLQELSMHDLFLRLLRSIRAT